VKAILNLNDASVEWFYSVRINRTYDEPE